MSNSSMSSRRRARLYLPLLALALASSLAACSPGVRDASPTGAGVQSPASASTATGSASTGGEGLGIDTSGIPGIDLVPADARDNYAGSNMFVKLQANPYVSWTPKAGPWKFCLSESYTGNNWRQNHVRELQREVEILATAGIADGELVITDANSNTALQLSQFQNLVDDGCDVMLVLPNSPEAMCDIMGTATDKGVLVLTSSAPVDCPKVMNVTHNGFHKMFLTAKAVAEALGGQGKVLTVTGVLGVTAEKAEQAAVDEVLKQYPGIEVVGSVEGKWTGSVAQAEVSKFLATHPGQIDGVFEWGEMDVASARAFQQAGRPMPVIGASSGEAAAYALWKDNPDKVVSAECQSPEGAAYEILHVALRMLNGQQPSLNTLIFPLPSVREANFEDYYDSSYTTATQGYPPLPDGSPVPDSYWDAFFTGGTPVDSSSILPAR